MFLTVLWSGQILELVVDSLTGTNLHLEIRQSSHCCPKLYSYFFGKPNELSMIFIGWLGEFFKHYPKTWSLEADSPMFQETLGFGRNHSYFSVFSFVFKFWKQYFWKQDHSSTSRNQSRITRYMYCGRNLRFLPWALENLVWMDVSKAKHKFLWFFHNKA